MGRWLAMVLVIVGASSYGLLSSFIKMAYDSGFTDGQITPAQMTMGTLLVWLLILFNKKSWVNPFKGPWVKLGLIGIFGLSLTTVFYNIALQELNASLSIVLLFQFTWMTIAMDCILKRRLPRKAESLAIVFILIGTLLAVNVLDTNWEHLSLLGLVYGLLSALTYSVFLFFTGHVVSPLPPLMNSAIMLTAAMPVMYILYPPTVFVHENGSMLLLWGLLLGFLGQVVPTVAFNIGIPRIGGTLAAMLGSVELPVAIIAAYLIIGEPVNGLQWLGMGLILGGILISENKT
ncbi:multidrug transporter [Paenibacillus marchantiophytorum]|uniref:Multidrug transporter n=1 Tax=Paenibacillus marchantiophytorum TaxID=1619310 RepID=A0ABQ1EZI7_9BACL|nr:DMT family transporter [Paenibacillus marchantiophytorum]GFZ93694.1 multidrug transporter [Paenibacillus marchantiophytorum]